MKRRSVPSFWQDIGNEIVTEIVKSLLQWRWAWIIIAAILILMVAAVVVVVLGL